MVIPTYNEALVIEQNLRQTLEHFAKSLEGHDWRVLVADNGSTDETAAIVRRLQAEHPRLGLTVISEKGRGRALRQVWQEEEADVYAYMDVDLATDLDHVPELLATLEDADVVVGSRFGATADVDRSWPREMISRSYRVIASTLVPTSVADLQCGFKAIKKEVAQKILPLTTHNGWFFDTEFIALAEAHGHLVKELPVRWKEKRDVRRKSTVKLLSTAWDDLLQLWKLRRRLKKNS